MKDHWSGCIYIGYKILYRPIEISMAVVLGRGSEEVFMEKYRGSDQEVGFKPQVIPAIRASILHQLKTRITNAKSRAITCLIFYRNNWCTRPSCFDEGHWTLLLQLLSASISCAITAMHNIYTTVELLSK